MLGLITLNMDGGPSDYAAPVFDFERFKWLKNKMPRLSDLSALIYLYTHPPVEGGSGTLSNYAETHVLDHVNGKTSFTMPATVALALTTTTPDSSKTGATIVEATYTGYGRQSVPNTSWAAATAGGAGAASTSSNSVAITFAACTASSSVIIGWALCDSATTAAGNMLHWGSATSTTISTTQTPATVAIGGLTQSLL
jgi:hypothetical protein